MARTMTVTQEETAATNPLLTGFLLLAVAVLLLGGLAGAVTDGGVAVASDAPVGLNP